jgi:Na+/H+ antiporter NhaD/arsenite permease-like protein
MGDPLVLVAMFGGMLVLYIIIHYYRKKSRVKSLKPPIEEKDREEVERERKEIERKIREVSEYKRGEKSHEGMKRYISPVGWRFIRNVLILIATIIGLTYLCYLIYPAFGITIFITALVYLMIYLYAAGGKGVYKPFFIYKAKLPEQDKRD